MKIILFLSAMLACFYMQARPVDQSVASVSAEWLEGPREVIVGNDSEPGRVRPGSRTLFVDVTNKTDVVLKIPTKELSLTLTDCDDYALVTIGWKYPEMVRGKKIITPQSSLGVAEIRKGETACIVNKVPEYWPVIKKPMRLKMDIPPDIWKRYELDFFSFIVDIEE